jgi:diaminopimelate epimerase
VLIKSHGLGNDYLVADPAELPFPVSPERVRLLCDRHFGVGSDGLLVLDGYEEDGEWYLRIYNPDGSEAEKSGNGIRIFGRWLWDTGRTKGHRVFWVNTIGGHASVEVHQDRSLTVEMGKPVFREDVTSLELEGRPFDVTALSIGNPHCVIFRPELDVTELLRLGPLVEHHAAFPMRTNVQLARPIDEHTLELLIWERGAGETQASGSSACAAVAAAHRAGLVGTDVLARMPGGNLDVRIDAAGGVHQHGPVEPIASLTLSDELIARLRALP